MKLILHLIVIFFTTSLSGQNLIPNPSFERITGCPDDFFQIYRADSWFPPDCAPLRPDTHGYAVLFNSCNYGNASVPNNAICSQFAHRGLSYAGIEVISAYDGVYRQYIETQLKSSLEKGKKYYFSMYTNLCEQNRDRPGVACLNADSTGVFFSDSIIDKNPNCLAFALKPDVHGDLLKIKPGDQWHNITGCYVASGDEKFILIGNFAGESVSNCSSVNTLAAFIFIDDVSLIPEVKRSFDTTLCQGEIWKINATDSRDEYKEMTGWSYAWSDGDTSSARNFANATKQKLVVSR